jgi:hypothetical protein
VSFRPITDVWILARPKVRYFGAFPAGFLLKARDLLSVGRDGQVLHVCSGKVREYKCGPACKGQTAQHYHGWGEADLTWDADNQLVPNICNDVNYKPAWLAVVTTHPDIQAVLADPPYTKEYAEHYRVRSSFPTADGIVVNAINILPVGGRVGILSMGWPRYPKDRARQIAIVGVLVGNGNIGRWYAVYERTA